MFEPDKLYPEDPDAVYYRPLLRDTGKVMICHVQWFDEFDYDQSRFLTEEKFSTEEAAKQWVRENLHVREKMLTDRGLFEE